VIARSTEHLVRAAAPLIVVLGAVTSTLAAEVDTALVLAVDVSGSVNGERYELQMNGIASALEDRAVQRAMLSGPRRSMAVTLVQWSDKPRVAIPWTMIMGVEDAQSLARRVRAAPRLGDDFTCLAQMLRFVFDKVLPGTPFQADRLLVDVSGDGRDNCNPAVSAEVLRDELVATSVTINGLPILEGDQAPTLENWYRENVIGGPGAFLVPADGYGDFARAIRQKFLVEMSAAAVWR
jgi:hypothetical protein